MFLVLIEKYLADKRLNNNDKTVLPAAWGLHQLLSFHCPDRAQGIWGQSKHNIEEKTAFSIFCTILLSLSATPAPKNTPPVMPSAGG
ncbi:hypothetical protein [Anaerobiospirillum sp. NML120511]|uniref:hypothetical protein n=1 Tax=Anaerobiospirillum sp. NML120511 TaxID=2932819 RepID=UPI001FF15379|nr:hypothetical protein [Anaerobiospirillum sp. NML120511]MCK0533832.1 hypothetical protein [Anaerobiospirillum sp. NML120511]